MANRPFLTAEWRDLLNFTYQVPPELLQSYLPRRTVLEEKDGYAFVSLVAFDFLKTRVKGIPIPFHSNFPEVNLRFYVRYQGQRGVVFIKEFVPNFMTAFIARKVYNEPYESIGMASEVEVTRSFRKVDHWMRYKRKDHNIFAQSKLEGYIPGEDTDEHFFKEHAWGFGTAHSGETKFYEVQHPVWEVYPIIDYKLSVDFGKLYGDQWAFLNDAAPFKVLYAAGSKIKVFNAKNLSEFPA